MFIDNMTVPSIGNNGVVNLSGTQIIAKSSYSYMRGLTISGGSNNVSAFAGAFYVTNTTCELESCTLVGNNCSGAAGALAAMASGHVSVSTCIVSGNSSVSDGGALYCVGAGAYATIVSSFITANSAGIIGGSKRGGGVFVANNAATVDIVGTTVTGNFAGYGKDIYALNTGVINASNCTFGDCYTSAGSYTFAGSNTIEKLAGVNGKVIVSSGASINLTSSIAPGGTGGITVLTGGCTVNGHVIAAGTYTTINSNGTTT